VDGDQVETGLARDDAHVTLRDVELRPRIVLRRRRPGGGSDDGGERCVLVAGRVAAIEFSWRWGSGRGEGASAYITDVQLKVSGAVIRVSPATEEDVAEFAKQEEGTEPSPSAPEASAAAAADPDWKARYMQQVVDHLALLVEDAEIVLDLPPTNNKGEQEVAARSSIVLSGRAIELVTLGRFGGGSGETGGGDLRQRISVGCLGAVIQRKEDDGSTEEFPLLDPLGYRAGVKRVSGRRFLDGLGAGLIISGERILPGDGCQTGQAGSMVTSNALRLHAGVIQVECLLQAQDMLGIVSEDTKEDAITAAEEPGPETDVGDSTKSSLFVLPVEFVALVLNNGTEIKAADCVVKYRTDGSLLEAVSSKGAILVDDRLINETAAGSWIVDMVKSCVVVRTSNSAAEEGSTSSSFFDAQQDTTTDDDGPELIASITVGLENFRKIYEGYADVSHLFAEDAEKTGEHVPTARGQGSGWSFATDGLVSFRFTSPDGRSIGASVLEPKIRYLPISASQATSGSGFPFVFQWTKLDVGQCSFGDDAVIRIPASSSSADGNTFAVNDKVEMQIDSIDTAQQAKSFLDQFLDVMESESSGIPFELSMPEVSLSLASVGGQCVAKGVTAVGFRVECESVRCVVSEGPLIEAGGVTFDVAKQAFVARQISTARFPGLGALSTPLTDVRLELVEDVLDIKLHAVDITLENAAGGADETQHGPASTDFDLPFSARLAIADLVLRAESTDSLENRIGHCTDLNINVEPKGPLVAVGLACGQFEFSKTDLLDTSIEGISGSAEFQPTSSQFSPVSCVIGMEEIQKFDIPGTGKLYKPTNKVQVSLDKNMYKVEAGTMMVQPYLDENRVQTSANEIYGPTGSDAAVFDRSVSVKIACLIAMSEFGSDKADIRCDELSMSFDPQWTGTDERAINGFAVGIDCGALQGRLAEPSPSDFLARRVSMKAFLDQSGAARGPVIPGLGRIHGVSLKLGVLSKASMQGVGQLSAPLQNASVEYTSGSLLVKCERIYCELESAGSDSSDGYDLANTLQSTAPWLTDITMDAPELLASLSSVNESLGDQHLHFHDIVISVERREEVLFCVSCSKFAGCGPITSSFAGSGLKLESLIVLTSVVGSERLGIAGMGEIRAMELMVETLSQFHLPRAGHLIAPVYGILLLLDDKGLRLESGSIRCVLDESKNLQDTEASETSNVATDWKFKFLPTTAIFPEIQIRESEAGLLLRLVGFNVEAASRCISEENANHDLKLSCDVFELTTPTVTSLEVEKITIDAGLEQGWKNRGSDHIQVPGLGALTTATFSADKIRNLSIPGVGRIQSPLIHMSGRFQNRRLRIGLSTLHWVVDFLPSDDSLGADQEPNPTAEATDPLNGMAYGVSIGIDRLLVSDPSNNFLSCGKFLLFIDPSLVATDQALALVGFSSAEISGKGPGGSAFMSSGISFQGNLCAKYSLEDRIAVPGLDRLSFAKLEIKEISTFSTDSFNLASPAESSIVEVQKGTVHVKTPSLRLVKKPAMYAEAHSGTSPSGKFSLPRCLLRASVECFELTEASSDETVEIVSCWNVDVVAEVTDSICFVKLSRVEDISYLSMLCVPSVSATAVVDMNDLECIRQLVVEMPRVDLSADFSSLDWSEALTKAPEKSHPLMLPFAMVQEFELTLKGKGRVLSLKDTTLHCKAFHGDDSTDIDSLTKHYVDIVKSRIPYLLSKTEVLGSNIGDSVGQFTGRALMHSTVVGSVAGVGIRDAVGGAITRGKSERGALASDRYHFGGKFH
jgi:hypothetical protein